MAGTFNLEKIKTLVFFLLQFYFPSVNIHDFILLFTKLNLIWPQDQKYGLLSENQSRLQ